MSERVGAGPFAAASPRRAAEPADDPLAAGLACDERSRALEARAAPPAPLPIGERSAEAPPWTADELRVLVRAEALSAEARAALAELPGASLEALPAPHGATACLRCDAAALARRVRERPDPRGDLARLLVAHAHAVRPPGEPLLLGVLNATPDSFSDGGRYLDPGRAAEHAARLVADGADALDVGGESTRPGADAVPLDEELARVLPVVERVVAAHPDVPVSIDTTKAEVAARALDLGARVVNDVSAGRFDPGMLPLVAERGAGFVAMHMRGRPRDMQVDPRYADPVAEVLAALRERVAACLQAGIALPKIAVDPGIGFGKRLEDNLALIRHLPTLRSLGRPLLVGVSRKAFVGRLSGVDRPEQRTSGTAAAVAACVLNGAEVLRVHDVGAMREVAATARALAGRSGPSAARSVFTPTAPS